MTLLIDQGVQNFDSLEKLSLVLVNIEILNRMVRIRLDALVAIPLLHILGINSSCFLIMEILDIKDCGASLISNLLGISLV